jgi:hypothetical protein
MLTRNGRLISFVEITVAKASLSLYGLVMGRCATLLLRWSVMLIRRDGQDRSATRRLATELTAERLE